MTFRFNPVLQNTSFMKTSLLLLVLLPAVLVSYKAIERRIVRKSFLNNEFNGIPHIVIDKSEYELSIYDDDGWYATYPVVFGNKDLSDKMMEGDRKTPEGTFKILSKRPHEKWGQFMLIDYPTPADVEKFNQRKAKGLVPKWAKIGGGIGIHGTWPRDEMVIDYFQNWTNGCVSLKRNEMTELYSLIPVGTQVTIQP
jgi:murein L,D-transpeptidase YafK